MGNIAYKSIVLILMLVLKKKTRRVPLKELLIFNLIKHTHPLSITDVWLSHRLTGNRSASPFNGLTNFPQIRVFNKEPIEDATCWEVCFNKGKATVISLHLYYLKIDSIHCSYLLTIVAKYRLASLPLGNLLMVSDVAVMIVTEYSKA